MKGEMLEKLVLMRGDGRAANTVNIINTHGEPLIVEVYRVKPKKPYIARIISWDSDRLMDDDAPVGQYVEMTPEVKALLGDMVDE